VVEEVSCLGSGAVSRLQSQTLTCGKKREEVAAFVGQQLVMVLPRHCACVSVHDLVL